MPARKSPPKRKASGQNIGEWQRTTERIMLRLPPDVAKQLRARARERGLPLSAYVARLVYEDTAEAVKDA